MRRGILMLLAAFLFLKSNSQCITGQYIKNEKLKSLEGEWIGVNGNLDTLRVILKYQEKIKVQSFFIDDLIGWHCYIRNGVLESNSLKDTLDNENSTIFIMSSLANDSINFILMDKGKSEGTASGFLTYDSIYPNTLKWNVESVGFGEGARVQVNGAPPLPPIGEKSKLTAVKRWEMHRITRINK